MRPEDLGQVNLKPHLNAASSKEIEPQVASAKVRSPFKSIEQSLEVEAKNIEINQLK